MLNFHFTIITYHGSSKCREKIVNFRSYKFTVLTFTYIANLNTFYTHRIITILDFNPSKVTRAALGGSRSPAECTTVWHNNGMNRLRWNQKKSLIFVHYWLLSHQSTIVEMRFMLWEMSGWPQWSMCRFIFPRSLSFWSLFLSRASVERIFIHCKTELFEERDD